MPARRKTGARRRRVGVALGAGGARGLAHIGVLRTLSDAGVPVDAVVGTSIGALVGALFAAGRLEEFERWARSLEWSDVVRMLDPVWPRAGLLSGARAADALSGMLSDYRIEDLALPFAAVCVDLVTGDEILIQEGRIVDAIRASISIPGVFVPHRAGRRLLVDGALRNPVPVSALEALGADVRLAVNLHSRPVREIASPGSRGRPPRRPTVTRRLTDAIERRFRRMGMRARARGDANDDVARGGPNLLEILTASMTVIEHELALHRLARDPVDVVLTPDVHAIRSFEFHKARQAIHAGVVEAETRLAEVRRVAGSRARRRYWSRGSNS